MKLIAKKSMRYGTRHLVPDESFETENDIHGLILIARRKAKKADLPTRKRKAPAVAPVEATVETPTEPVEAVAPEEPQKEPEEAAKAETEAGPPAGEKVMVRPIPHTSRFQTRR